MTLENRRDSFRGKMSVRNHPMRYGTNYSLIGMHAVDPESDFFKQDLREFAAVCRVVTA